LDPLPPPEVMAPDAIPLPAKRETFEKSRSSAKSNKPNKRPKRAKRRRAAMRVALMASGSGASQSVCLAHVASDLRRHTPGSTSLAAGHAHVTFRINMGGGISDISVSASTPADAALARRIVASSRGPGSCSSAFVSQSFAFH